MTPDLACPPAALIFADDAIESLDLVGSPALRAQDWGRLVVGALTVARSARVAAEPRG